MNLPRVWLSFPLLSLLSLSCSSSTNRSRHPPLSNGRNSPTGDWTLEPGQEDPRWCKKIVLTEDIYVAAMRPVHPVGTHHTTLSLVPDDGKTTCTGSTFGPGLIYAAGLGTGSCACRMASP